MLPAVATVDAIDAATRGSVRAGIKWVGDVLVDGRKVAGSLTATRVLRGEIDTAVFGVGLNVSVVPDVPPTPFVPVAGCLRQHPGGTHLTLGGVLRQVLHALETRVTRLRAEGPAPLASDYRRASIVVGRRVRIWDDAVTSDTDPAGWPAPLAAGLIIDVGSDLRLTLQGRREPIDRGRLAFEDACARFGI
jgi:biotin-(acetyl-CoA carboxylase) ligase